MTNGNLDNENQKWTNYIAFVNEIDNEVDSQFLHIKTKLINKNVISKMNE